MRQLDYALIRERLSGGSWDGAHVALVQLDAIIDPRPRNLAIYRAAVADFPEIRPALEAAERGESDDTMIGTLQQAVMMSPADRAALYAFWHSRYHEESWLHYDVPYRGASALLHQLARDGFHLVYLCDRDGPNMGMGTAASFRRNNLPSEPEAEFLYRSAPEIPEHEYLERSLEPFIHRGVALVVETRADRANRIHELVPYATVVLLGADPPQIRRKLYPSIMTCESYAAAR